MSSWRDGAGRTRAIVLLFNPQGEPEFIMPNGDVLGIQEFAQYLATKVGSCGAVETLAGMDHPRFYWVCTGRSRSLKTVLTCADVLGVSITINPIRE